MGAGMHGHASENVRAPPGEVGRVGPDILGAAESRTRCSIGNTARMRLDTAPLRTATASLGLFRADLGAVKEDQEKSDDLTLKSRPDPLVCMWTSAINSAISATRSLSASPGARCFS